MTHKHNDIYMIASCCSYYCRERITAIDGHVEMVTVVKVQNAALRFDKQLNVKIRDLHMT